MAFWNIKIQEHDLSFQTKVYSQILHPVLTSSLQAAKRQSVYLESHQEEREHIVVFKVSLRGYQEVPTKVGNLLGLS